MNHTGLRKAALRVLQLLEEYSNAPHREMLIDPALYAFLEGHFGLMSRQHPVEIAGHRRPARIDYRQGGSNPTVIEFAVRPPLGGPQLYGSQNRAELRKLTRIPQTRAKRRVLLLLDRHRIPLSRASLEPTYESVTAGPGNFQRRSVRVQYVHVSRQFNFLWTP